MIQKSSKALSEPKLVDRLFRFLAPLITDPKDPNDNIKKPEVGGISFQPISPTRALTACVLSLHPYACIHARISIAVGWQEEFKAEQQLVGRLVHKFQNSNPDVLFKVVIARLERGGKYCRHLFAFRSKVHH